MKVALIQALIPIGLAYVRQMLQQEVMHLVGPRYAWRGESGNGNYRWGKQGGSITT